MSFISLQQMYDAWKRVADWVGGVNTYKPKVEVSNFPATGSYTRLSTEPKPTVGIQDGNDLLEVDTGKVFVFYKGVWREI